jgi:formate dehydrogenase major subunit
MGLPQVSALSRRDFLRLGVGSAALASAGIDPAPLMARARTLKIARTSETRSTCPYCSVSCGVIIHTLGGREKNTRPEVIYVEGDPDHPINRGSLCPKGITLKHDIVNERRLTHPRYRGPGETEFRDIAWEEAIGRIARAVKTARDRDFLARDAHGRRVNRLETVAAIGGCTDTNEFNYLFQKVARSWGVVHLEQQSRI